tara:strand:- start:16681 stop:17259 length:579 start_codon:yes stop_codon:yes gene_type:complete
MKISILVILLIFTGACTESVLQESNVASSNNNSQSVSQEGSEVFFTSNLGDLLSLNGTWSSGCVEDTSGIFSERLTFSENKVTDHITYYSEPNCTVILNDSLIEMEFEINGTIDLELEGLELIANKVSGIQRVGNEEKPIKQSIAVVELTFYAYGSTKTVIAFNKARLQDDGGVISSDGYPVELLSTRFYRQ